MPSITPSTTADPVFEGTSCHSFEQAGEIGILGIGLVVSIYSDKCTSKLGEQPGVVLVERTDRSVTHVASTSATKLLDAGADELERLMLHQQCPVLGFPELMVHRQKLPSSFHHPSVFWRWYTPTCLVFFLELVAILPGSKMYNGDADFLCHVRADHQVPVAVSTLRVPGLQARGSPVQRETAARLGLNLGFSRSGAKWRRHFNFNRKF